MPKLPALKWPSLTPHLYKVSYLGGCLVLLLLAVANLYLYLGPTEVLGVATETQPSQILINEKSFWTSFLATNPSYVPGWIELAKIEFELGNTESARNALDEAKKISPNLEVTKLAPELQQLGKI